LPVVKELRPPRRPVLLKRNCQQVHQVVRLFVIHVGVDAVDDLAGPIDSGERPKQPVPDREDVPVVGVGQRLGVVVVHFMHIRRYEDARDEAIESTWARDVRMGDLGEKGRKRLVEENHPD